MKNLVILILMIVVFKFFITFMFSTNSASLTKVIQAQTQSSATPCQSPKNLGSNMFDPCHPPKTPSPQEIAEQQRQWEITKKKLFTANFPVKNELSADADGDNKMIKFYTKLNLGKQILKVF